jgi:hypothetical protein
MKTIKIISDGRHFGSEVIDANTGEIIPGICSLDLKIRPSKPNYAELEFVSVEAEVIAFAEPSIEARDILAEINNRREFQKLGRGRVF